MKLSKIYNNQEIRNSFWNKLEEESLLKEDNSPKLINLIKEANETVFKKFGINPSDRKYFIAGSGRLHFYPEFLSFLGIDTPIGDLDIVIPNKEDWVKAGLEKEWNSSGVYKANNNDTIEVFSEWLPSKAGGPYADVNVRDTNTILNAATKISGYYFMSMTDIVDYKLKMDREKESDIVAMMQVFISNPKKNGPKVLRGLSKTIGVNNARKLFK